MPGGRVMWRSMRVKLVAVYLLLILFSLQLIGGYFVRALTASLIHSQTQSVQNQAQLVSTIVAPEMAKTTSTSGAEFTPVLSSLPQLLTGSVYVLNSEGVVEDTSAGTALVGQKRVDSIATQALVGKKRVAAIRYDPVSQIHVLAVAVPIWTGHTFLGIVEDIVPIQSTYATVQQVTTIFYTGSGIALVLTAILGIILSRIITRPVLDVTQQARDMAEGDFSRRVDVQSDDELGVLGKTINELADKLEEALAENAQERERLTTILKYMGDGVIAFDTSFVPMFGNDAAQYILRLLGTSLREAAKQFGLSKDVFAKGASDYEKVHPVGNTIYHVLLTKIHNQAAIRGYVAVIRDITEQEKLNQARRDFVANVSHELRTPLTSIKSYIEALTDADSEISPETQTKFLSVIDREADRMVRLTRDLLQLSGLDTQQSTVDVVRVNVQTWLFDSIHRFELEARAANVHIEWTGRAEMAISGNQDMLDRLLDNLLANALQYTPADGKVTVHSKEEAKYAVISVSDTGIGIPEADLPHVFERFYRVDKARSRRKGGSGLGLALAQEIAEHHQGRLEIASEVGKGTRVTVYLPLLSETEALPPTEQVRLNVWGTQR